MDDFQKRHPTETVESVKDQEQDTVGTPEGDNEFAPDQPLSSNPPTPERPRGNEAHPTQPLRPAQE